MMRIAAALSILTLIGACSTGQQDDDLIFADGSRFNREKFIAGMRQGCDSKAVETAPYFDRRKYCTCIEEYVLANDSSISLRTTSGDEKEVSVDLVSHFESPEGSSQVAQCSREAIDTAKFWTAQEKSFRDEMTTRDPALAKSEQYPAYLNCVWDKVRDSVSVMEALQPEFSESARLRGFAGRCAEQNGLVMTE